MAILESLVPIKRLLKIVIYTNTHIEDHFVLNRAFNNPSQLRCKLFQRAHVASQDLVVYRFSLVKDLVRIIDVAFEQIHVVDKFLILWLEYIGGCILFLTSANLHLIDDLKMSKFIFGIVVALGPLFDQLKDSVTYLFGKKRVSVHGDELVHERLTGYTLWQLSFSQLIHQDIQETKGLNDHRGRILPCI